MKKITLLLTFLIILSFKSYAQFPAPYCGPITFQFDVEPITLVNFAGINNTSAEALSGPAHEDFTTISGSVDAGNTYPITLKGNTGGAWTNNFIVFIDWNQDNDFVDAGESYEIGTIFSSTGTDDIQASGMITVPSTAMAGSTRMRIIKSYAGYSDSCNTTELGYGQAEDYSLSVIIPTCLAPSNGVSTVTSATTADLSWSSTETEFAIVVQTAGTGTPSTADGTGEEVTGTTYAATGLTGATAYEFYVRTECSPGLYSSWAGPFSFNTTMLPNCASNPTPADGAINVPVGPITLTWDVPSTGDAPTSYDLFYGETADDVTILLGNYPTNTTGTDLTLNGFGVTVYWKIVPKNIAGSATGCAVWSFTTEAAPGYCLSAEYGQYPGGTAGYTPTTCDGITSNDITASGFASEYSLVNVTNGQTYVFTSSIATDFITISNAAGTVSFIAATTPVTWVSDLDGQIRFYTHTDDQCGASTTSRTRGVTCGVVSSDAPDYANLQWPATIEIPQGGSGTVYGQVYEPGLTDVAPNIEGQAPGITAWVGISPEGANTNPATWTNWEVATHNAANIGNNDEYMATIGAALAPGTYYYATRFRLNSGAYVYGGFQGGFWNGTTNVSGVLTILPPPVPVNDECSAPIALTPGGIFADNSINATNLGASMNMTDAAPSCGDFNIAQGKDVWFSVVIPSSGSITIETAANGTLTDSAMEVYEGTCGSITSIMCNDDIGFPNYFSRVILTGRTPGEVVLVRVWGYNASAGNFDISAYDASLSMAQFSSDDIKVYPNPVRDVLNLDFTAEITSLSVYNLLGQKVIGQSVGANTAKVDMSAMPQGAYIVRIESGNLFKTIKVIKE